MEREDLERTLNCGVGMVALSAPSDADVVIGTLAAHGIPAWVAGEVREPSGADEAGRVRLVGEHG